MRSFFRKLGLAAALAGAVSLGGCAGLSNGFNAIVTDINAPATQQAIATLGVVTASITKLTAAVSCDISGGTEFAKSIEAGFNAKQNLVGLNNSINLGSTAACTFLNGRITGSAKNVTGVTLTNLPSVVAVTPVAQ